MKKSIIKHDKKCFVQYLYEKQSLNEVDEFDEPKDSDRPNKIEFNK